MRDRSRAAGRAAVAAVTFLTIAPVGRRVEVTGEDVARGAALLPAVGAVLGAAAGCAAWLLAAPAGPLLASVVAVALLAVGTGALHLDGLADTADGFGGRTPADRLRIMRDHAVGAYGVVALVLALLAKVAAGAALAGRADAVAVWAAAGALSRSVGPALAAALPYAQRPGGSGSVLHGGRAAARAVAAGLSAVALTAAVLGCAGGSGAGTAVPTSAALAVTAGVAVAAGVQARRRLGGVTGDVLGAATETTEIVVLAVLGGILR